MHFIELVHFVRLLSASVSLFSMVSRAAVAQPTFASLPSFCSDLSSRASATRHSVGPKDLDGALSATLHLSSSPERKLAALNLLSQLRYSGLQIDLTWTSELDLALRYFKRSDN